MADSGNGISDNLKTHLFERFYSQNKNSAEGGTGIGLFLTKRLVEIHNGNITFVSEEGKGTVFHVVIPMITEGTWLRRISLPTVGRMKSLLMC